MTVVRKQIEVTDIPFGKAEVLFGDAYNAGGLTPLGLIEGDVVAQLRRTFNNLTFPEYTADAVHSSEVSTGGITVTLPLLLTSQTQIARLQPTADIDLGSDRFREVVPKQMLIIAQREIPEPPGGLSFDGALWAPAAPVIALWIWKAVPNLDRLVWGHSDKGRRYVEVPVECQWDATKPARNKMATFGNPAAQGIGTIRL